MSRELREPQALLRGEFGLALRRDLADKNVAWVDLRADIDNAALVEVLQRFFVDVGEVARDLLSAQLRVARLDLELLDVNRGELVLAHDGFTDEDRVLEVVALPGHERHQQVASERELAGVGRRTIGKHIALADACAAADRDAL
jgi:uncharacterized protein (UPF0371 family)